MIMRKRMSLVLAVAVLISLLSGCGKTSYPSASPAESVQAESDAAGSAASSSAAKGSSESSGKYSTDQALSDKAQLSTIAFSGLAFITGNSGVDGFFPPGKVADFFGFQYMRDVDTAGYGHNTQYLSRVANNVLYIQADSHLDENTVPALYEKTLAQIKADAPSFLMDLGDTFMIEKLTKTYAEAEARFELQKKYLRVLGTIPLFLVNGNHDGEQGWVNTEQPEWTKSLREQFFPNPLLRVPDYSAAAEGNYYAFCYGSALFVALDPYTFTTVKRRSDADGWDCTLGKTQYDWLAAYTAPSATSARSFSDTSPQASDTLPESSDRIRPLQYNKDAREIATLLYWRKSNGKLPRNPSSQVA